MKQACYDMLHRAFDLDEFFTATKATENGHEIWNMDRQEPLQVRFTENSIKIISKT